MNLSRRKLMQLLAGSASAVAVPRVFGQQRALPAAPAPIAAPPGFGVAPGPFQPTWESLSTYRVPDWYRDAKFGIWAHWGPQCQPEMGDWYAQRMYQEKNTAYDSMSRSTATRRSSASRTSFTSGRPTSGSRRS